MSGNQRRIRSELKKKKEKKKIVVIEMMVLGRGLMHLKHIFQKVHITFA